MRAEWDFDPTSATINVSLTTYGKTPTRLLEGLFLRFNASSGTSAPLQWGVDKLGEWVNPFDVHPGGNQHHHGTWAGVRAVSPGPAPAHALAVGAPDASVSCFGTPTVFPAPVIAPADPAEGASFVLLDQLWNTNCECNA